jgi:O-methyltransferase/aklanonic acid methyltransferase
VSDDAETLKARATTRFNAIADGYDQHGAFAHFGQRLVAAVGIEPGQRVLDVATGPGAVLFAAAKRIGVAGDLIGVDLAENMVRATNVEAERRGLAACAVVMDAERLDFPDAGLRHSLAPVPPWRPRP